MQFLIVDFFYVGKFILLLKNVVENKKKSLCHIIC